MAWLSSGLSQLSGQLSDLTKEVLTEGTEEVDDHVTELRVAKSKISELESHCAEFRAETERLQKVNYDLSEKLESAELQLTATHNEYRQRISDKELEIQKLRHQNQELQESAGHTLYPPPATSSSASLTTTAATHTSAPIGSLSDAHNFDDVISCQTEIYRLQSHVRNLEAQLQQQQQQQKQQHADGEVHSSNANSTNLVLKIKELEQELSSQVDDHQHQLAALQDVHRRKLSHLKQQLQAKQDECSSRDVELSNLRARLEAGDSRVPHDADNGAPKEPSRTLGSNAVEEIVSEPDFRLHIRSHPSQQTSTPMPSLNDEEHGSRLEQRLKQRLGELEAQLADQQEQSRITEQDWSSEKQALEEVVITLRQQLKQHKTKTQNDNAEFQQKKDKLVHHIKSLGLDTLHESLREAECEELGVEEKLVEEIEKQVNNISVLEQQLQEAQQSAQNVQQLQDSIQKKNEELEELQGQLDVSVAEVEKVSQLFTETKHQLEQAQQQSNARTEQEERSGDAGVDEDEVARLLGELDQRDISVLELEGEMGLKEEEIDQLQSKLEDTVNEREKYKREKEELIKSLEEVKLHYDKQTEMSASVDGSREEKPAGVTGETTYGEELSAELQACDEEIAWLKAELEKQKQENQQLQTDNSCIDSLKEQLVTKTDAEKSATAENEQLRVTVDDLKEQLKDLTADKLNASSHVEELLLKFDNMDQSYNNRIKEFLMKIESLETQRDELERELSSTEEKLTTQKAYYDGYIADMTKAQNLSSSSVEAENNKLMKVNHEKDVKMSELEMECESLKAKVEEAKEMMQSAIDGRQQLTDLLGEKDFEITNMRLKLEETRKMSEEDNLLIKEYEAEIERLKYFENKYQEIREQNAKLKKSCEDLELELKENKLTSPSKVDAKTLDVMTDLESEIRSQKRQIESDGEKVCLLEKRLADNQNVICEKDGQIKDLTDKVHAQHQELNTTGNTILRHVATIEELQSQIAEQEEKINHLKETSEENGKDDDRMDMNKKLIIEHGLLNGEVKRTAEDIREEMKSMKSLMSQKDNIITELRNSNTSLMHMLEDKSMAEHGSKVMVEVHDLQSEVKKLRLEKDQMTAVLSEKSREASSLKSEVHRLMGIISAEKSALAKLQQDNNMLISQQGKSSSQSEADGDMTRETVKNLSRIIRDKDLEIESLNLKNTTLLQVLQDSSGDNQVSQLSTVIQERDNLLKQVAVFQQDREQIISALNAKHQESVTYHAEIQRLMALRHKDTEASDGLKHDYTLLSQQYEDKSQALLKSQHEMMNYKHKLMETENRLNQMKIQHRNRKQRQSQEEPKVQESEIVANSNTECEVYDTGASDTTDTGGHMNGIASDNASIPSASTAAGHVDLRERTKRVRQRMDSEELCELEIELNQLRFNIHEKDIELNKMNGLLAEKTQHYSQQMKNMELKLQEVQKQRDNIFNQKDKAVTELNTTVHKKDEVCRQKEAENNVIRKQLESMTFRLSESETAASDLKECNKQLIDKLDAAQSELSELRDAYNRVTIVVGDKDHEIDTIKEKLSAMQRAMEDQGSGRVGEEVQRSLDEAETMHIKATQYRQERDQAYGTLQQQTNANEQLRQQCELLAEQRGKLERELERLRTHLVQIEDGYTQEALAAEQREKDLRNRLAAAEEKVIHSSSAMQSASENVQQQLQALQQQLYSVAQQRDDLTLQLSQCRDTNTQYATSLANLQMVLEQFQQERDFTQAAESEKFQRQLIQVQDEKNKLEQTVQHLQNEVQETQHALEAAQRLSEQLDKKQQTITALKEEVLLREHELERREAEINRLATHSESRVDKQLMKSLFLGYFHTASNQKAEVLHVVARILEFSNDEMTQLLTEGQERGWLGGWFNRTTAPSIHGGGGSPRHRPHGAGSGGGVNQSFSELFVNFLERESTPKPTVSLPAEAMAEQQQRKQQQHKQQQKAVPFNPFNAPRHPTSLPVNAAGPAGQQMDPAHNHPLMQPISPTPPMYQPIMSGGSDGHAGSRSSGGTSVAAGSSGTATIPVATIPSVPSLPSATNINATAVGGTTGGVTTSTNTRAGGGVTLVRPSSTNALLQDILQS